MKKILGAAAIVAVTITACGDGQTGQREHEMNDNTVEAPTTPPRSNTSVYDTSTGMDVRDSSTTVARDSSVTPNK